MAPPTRCHPERAFLGAKDLAVDVAVGFGFAVGFSNGKTKNQPQRQNQPQGPSRNGGAQDDSAFEVWAASIKAVKDLRHFHSCRTP